MKKHFSRRSMMTKLGAATAGVLLQRRFSSAELLAPPSGTEEASRAVKGAVGMDVTLTAVTDSTLRISVAAVDEVLDQYYDDGSVAPRHFARPMLVLRTDADGQDITWGEYTVSVASRSASSSLNRVQTIECFSGPGRYLTYAVATSVPSGSSSTPE